MRLLRGIVGGCMGCEVLPTSCGISNESEVSERSKFFSDARGQYNEA